MEIKIFVWVCAVLYYLFCMSFMTMDATETEEPSDSFIKRLFSFLFLVIISPIATPVMLGCKLAEKDDTVFAAAQIINLLRDMHYEIDKKLEDIDCEITELNNKID